MASRDSALARALTFFDSNGFRDRLADLVAIPSTSQDPGHEADVQRYLADAIQPWLERMGFAVEIYPNPVAGFGPFDDPTDGLVSGSADFGCASVGADLSVGGNDVHSFPR